MPPNGSDSCPRILPVATEVQRRGRDLERFLNLWRLGFLGATTLIMVLGRLGAVTSGRPEFGWSVAILATMLVAALAFQLYLAWFSWPARLGIYVVAVDLGAVVIFQLGLLILDRAIVATNSEIIIGFFVVVALAGVRSDPRVARMLFVAVPLSYVLVVFLAVAWCQVQLAPPDPIYGTFRWEIQLVRLGALSFVTWLTQYQAALGASERAEAEHDPLTGVYNRRFLETFLLREVPRARRRQQPLAVLLLDLDGFKAFNDTHGHLAGDDLLVDVATALASAVRSTDVVARYGGDEFVVVLPGSDGETARRIARELIRVIPSRVSLSAGVGCLADRVASVEELLAAADRGLLAAKRSGGGVVIATDFPGVAGSRFASPGNGA